MTLISAPRVESKLEEVNTGASLSYKPKLHRGRGDIFFSHPLACLSPFPSVEGWGRQTLGDFSPGRLSLVALETWGLQRAFSHSDQKEDSTNVVAFAVPSAVGIVMGGGICILHPRDVPSHRPVPALPPSTAGRVENLPLPLNYFYFIFFRGANKGRLL